MFISILDLFKLGIGPSSSHTNGPMVAAKRFVAEAFEVASSAQTPTRLRCVLKGSLAHTGEGHGTDKAIILGLNNYAPSELIHEDAHALVSRLARRGSLVQDGTRILFNTNDDVVFDTLETLREHPNGMVFSLEDMQGLSLLKTTYFSIGGGFIATEAEIKQLEAPIRLVSAEPYPYPFESAQAMLDMAAHSGKSIAQMKLENEIAAEQEEALSERVILYKVGEVWQAMKNCVEKGLSTEGELPGGLKVQRRAYALHQGLVNDANGERMNEWLCAYAMAVNEENAAGHAVVTAPTNGAAGVIPAVLYYYLEHDEGDKALVVDFLLTAAAIGGLIKHKSSISGAEVGCQGEVGSAAAMAAAGLCAVKGGSPKQVENAAEIALEHHLGMTCDPVQGLVQVPCIERNGFGAIKAYTAASLALKGTGDHFMPLDNCIEAMRQTGQEMSSKFKETALGGLAQSWTEC